MVAKYLIEDNSLQKQSKFKRIFIIFYLKIFLCKLLDYNYNNNNIVLPYIGNDTV